MKKSPWLYVILLTFFSQLFFAQSEKPKVALVLSGGGAKGIAHIPLLQTLDSLGIVPDIVIGTSMGSVVGAFYAVGYSGDSIAHIAHQADWDVLLGGDITLKDVGMEEKSEFKRHLVNFDIIEGKPKVNSGLLKDQKLKEFFSSYIYPVYNVEDFDDFSIPYRAMTTDIVNGKEVLFDKGRLGLAMRASMSIPGVFEPIAYDGTLLVDGGVLNNFPVDVAKEMGYDFIIGSDVGGGMQKIDKLNSIPALLFQTGMLTSNLKNPQSRADCNILIDHIPNITYSTGDFSKSDEIYLEGKTAVGQNIEALVALSEQLKNFEQREHKIPAVKDEFLLDTIYFEGISEANLDLVKARSKIKSHESYSIGQLIDAIDHTMGTNLFNQITFSPDVANDKIALTIDGIERSRNVIQGSLHYDTYRGVGLMVNYTGRNIVGKASRFLITADIAEQPRLRIQYQKLFGPEKNWWWRSELLGEYLEQKLFLQGEVAEDMKSRYFQFDNQFNKNINSLSSYVGLDVSYEYNDLRPKLNPKINENLLGLDLYSFNNIEVGIHFLLNKMDHVFYPYKGTFLRTSVSRSFLHDVELLFIDPDVGGIKGTTNGFTKFNIDVEKRIFFSTGVTGIIGVNGAFIFEDKIKSGELPFSEFGYAATYSLGGIVAAPRRGNYIFPGLHEDELFVSQMMRLNLGVQLHPFSKFYLTPHVNLASVGFKDFNAYIDEAFSPNGDWTVGRETSSIISAGINVGYRSFLGPLNFDVSYVNDIDKVRLFFSVGLLFNRSN